MPNNASQTHYNSVLTGVAVEFTPPELKAREVFKPIPVVKESDVYPVFDKDLFDAPDDNRADGTESNKSEVGWKYVPYKCEEHALHDVITKRMRDNAMNEMDLEAIKTRAVKQKVLNNIEKAVFGSGGLLRTAGNNSYSANVDLSNPATATPRSAFQTGINNVESNCGKSPNTCVIGTDTLRAITRMSEYREEVKYTKDIRNEDLPDELYGLQVISVGALVNTNRKGQAKSPSRLMSDDVWIGYIEPGEALPMETVTYGALLYTEEYADIWFEKALRGDKLEYGYIYYLALIAKECGGLLQSVLTA